MTSPRWTTTLLIGILLLAPPAAQAQEADTYPSRVLSPAQLDWFAGVVSDDPSIVEQRLVWDPALVPMAAAAMDAGLSRRRVGLTLTVAGFSAAVVGLVLGAVVWASGIRLTSDCPYEGGSNCESPGNDEATMHKGKMIMVISMVAGLSAGIPGVIILGGSSQAEDDVLQRYRSGARWRPAVFPPSRTLPGSPSGKTLGLPLLSVRF